MLRAAIRRFSTRCLEVWSSFIQCTQKNIQKLIFIAAGSHTQLIRIFNKEMLEYEKKLSFANKKRLLLLFVPLIGPLLFDVHPAGNFSGYGPRQ